MGFPCQIKVKLKKKSIFTSECLDLTRSRKQSWKPYVCVNMRVLNVPKMYQFTDFSLDSEHSFTLNHF